MMFFCPSQVSEKLGRLAPYFMGLLLIAAMVLMVSERCQGYVMPAEQLIQFMAKNFSKFKTLIITQSTYRENQGDEEAVEAFEEKIWMKSPDLYHSEMIHQSMGSLETTDHTFRRLLIANSKQRLMQFLSGIGINLHKVAFTRIDGIIAYRIGDKGPDGPKVIIEKKRFLPLLLVYGLSENPDGDIIRVRIRDYREVEQGWYPFEITYSSGDRIRETYAIHTLQANMPIDPSLFYSPKAEFQPDKAPEKGESPEEEDRLRQIIKTFEQKYGNKPQDSLD